MEALVEGGNYLDNRSGIGGFSLDEAFGDGGDDFGEVFFEGCSLDIFKECGEVVGVHGGTEALDDGGVLFQR